MRYLLLLLLAGCEPAGEPVGVPRLQDVRSITVKYGRLDAQRPGFGGNYRQMKVSDAKDVKTIVGAFHVQSTWRASIGLAFPARVDFHLADGSSVKCWIVGADTVECQGYQVYLRDRTFYDRVNAVLSRKEGHACDIWNDPIVPQ